MVNWILFLLSFSLSFPLFLFVAHHVCYQTQLTLILKMDLRLHCYKFCSVVFLSSFFFSFLQHSLQDDLQLLGSCLNFSSHRHTSNRAFICQKAGATELNHSASCWMPFWWQAGMLTSSVLREAWPDSIQASSSSMIADREGMAEVWAFPHRFFSRPVTS